MKLIVLLIALAALVGAGPDAIGVQAQEPDRNGTRTAADFGLDPQAVEITALRTTDSKTFDLGNGQRVMVVQQGMHVDRNGLGLRDPDLGFNVVGRAATDALFSGRNLTVVDAMGRGITWTLPNVPISVQGERATYTHNGVDWTYHRFNEGVKLEGVVSTHRGVATYSFPFMTNSPLSIRDDGTIRGNGFVVGRPFAVDAVGRVALADWRFTGEGLAFTLDDAGLVVPYVIDPTTTFTGSSQVQDVMVSTSAPDSNLEGQDTLFIGDNNSSSNRALRIFIKFPTVANTIPSTAIVTASTLSLYEDQASGTGSWSAEVQRAAASWANTTITYNNQPGVTGSITSITLDGTAANAYVSWSGSNLVTDVQGWVSGTHANNGWRVSCPTCENQGASTKHNRFGATERTSSAERPKLVVTYTEMAVTGLSPDVVPANDTISFTVTGEVFTGVTAARLEKGGESNVNCTDVVVNSDTEVEFNCDLNNRAGGAWNLRLLKGSNSTVFNNILDVRALAVTIVSPSQVGPSGTAGLTVTGDGFDAGAAVKLEKSGETDITCTSVVVVSLTEITADCGVDEVASGFWDLRVTNSPSSTTQVLSDALFVTAVITLIASGVDPGEYTLRIVGDSSGIFLFLGDELRDSHGAQVEVEDTAHDWDLFAGGALPYVESLQITIGGVLMLWYELDLLPDHQLTDRSGEGHHAIARYPDTISGVTSALGAAEATAPAGGVEPAAGSQVLGEVPAQVGFSDTPTSSSGGFFLFDIMSSISDSSGFPYQAMVGMFAIALTLVGMVLTAWIFKSSLPVLVGVAVVMIIFWRMGALPGWMPILFVIGPGLFFLIWRRLQ